MMNRLIKRLVTGVTVFSQNYTTHIYTCKKYAFTGGVTSVTSFSLKYIYVYRGLKKVYVSRHIFL